MKLRVKIFYLRKKYFETFIKKKGRIAFNGLFGNHQSRRFGSGSLEHCLEWHLVQKLKLHSNLADQLALLNLDLTSYGNI